MIQIKEKYIHIIVFFVYLSVSLIYFGRQIFGGRLLVFTDSFFYFYPLKVYYGNKIFENMGLHLWLPYEYLGLPLLGIMQLGILYPFNFLYFFLPAHFVFNLNFILHYVLAAFFTYLYLRLLGIRAFPSFVAGLVFAYSGYLLGYIKSFTALQNAATWLPLILYLYEMLRRTLRLRYTALAALVVAIQILAGNYQISVYTYLLLGLFALFYSSKIENEKRIRFLLLSLLPILLGSLIALPQLVATKELSDQCWRQGLGYNFFTEGSFSPFLLLSWLLPFTSELWPHDWPWPTAEVTLSPIVPVVQILAIWAAIKLRKKDIHTFFWGLVAIIAFFLALGRYNPLYHLMYYVPIYNLFRVPLRHLLEYNFAIAVLSAIALNYLFYNPDAKKATKSLITASCIVVGFSILLIIFLKTLIADPLFTRLLTQEAASTLTRVIRLINSDFAITFLSYFIFIIWLYILIKHLPQRSLPQHIIFAILPALVVLNGYQFDRFRSMNYQFQDPLMKHIFRLEPKMQDINNLLQDPIFKYIKKTSPFDRSVFVASHSDLYNVPAEVHTLNGYDPLITYDFAELLYMKHWATSTNWVGLLQNNLLLSTLNVRYVILPQQDIEKYRLNEIKTARRPPSEHISLGRWDLSNSRDAGKGEFVLVSPDSHTVSMLHQQLSLHPNTFYILSLDARSVGEKATAMLSYDLYSPNYDSHDQELDVEVREIKQTYRTYYRIINTGNNIPPRVELRVFTFSRKPVAVRNIQVKELGNFAPPYIAGQYPGEKEGAPIYQKVFESSGWVVYQNENCLPRAFTVTNLDIGSDIRDIKKGFEVFEFNPFETALVSHGDMARIGRKTFTKGNAKIDNYDTDRIVIDAEFRNGPGFLVLADQYFPGWKAYVDGKETFIYKVDGLLRGVVVSEGRHTVEFKYRPEKVFISGLVSIMTLLATLFMALKW